MAEGNVKAEIFNGSCDVIVCDGFVGNLVLKASEGVAATITGLIKDYIRKSPIAITGALLMRKVFALLKKQMDYAEIGGAPLLGIKGCVIVSHGKSNPKAIKNAMKTRRLMAFALSLNWSICSIKNFNKRRSLQHGRHY
jgi:glycerol-3-phosphate acyltransferase PlsX